MQHDHHPALQRHQGHVQRTPLGFQHPELDGLRAILRQNAIHRLLQLRAADRLHRRLPHHVVAGAEQVSRGGVGQRDSPPRVQGENPVGHALQETIEPQALDLNGEDLMS